MTSPFWRGVQLGAGVVAIALVVAIGYLAYDTRLRAIAGASAAACLSDAKCVAQILSRHEGVK